MWPPRWSNIAAKAENSFQYMLEHDMVQEDHIDHFCIYSANLTLHPYSDEFHEAYATDVEQMIIPWIREEEKSGRLKDRQQWRIIRDAPYYEQCMMGYNRLFVYLPTHLPTGDRSYRASFGPCEVPSNGRVPQLLRAYFMLSIAPFCYHPSMIMNDEVYEACRTCITNPNSSCTPNFMASLYGWEEDDMPYLKPHVYVGHCDKEIVDHNMPMVSSMHWEDSPSADAAVWGHDDSESSVE